MSFKVPSNPGDSYVWHSPGTPALKAVPHTFSPYPRSRVSMTLDPAGFPTIPVSGLALNEVTCGGTVCLPCFSQKMMDSLMWN
jgi:hypothetical protein